MALPVISSITFDKPSYAVGQTITATVTYSGTNVSAEDFAFTGTVEDTTTGETGTATGTLVIDKPNLLAASVSDSGSRTWTKVSDNGVNTAEFTAVA